MVGANHRVLICCTCHFQSGSLCLGSSVCWSLQCLISVQTQGGNGGHFFRLTCSLVLWGGGTLQTNITGVCGECSQCFARTGFAPTHGVCAFPVYTVKALGCSAGELSEAGPGLHAIPRSKTLRFRFSGTPQRHRLSWACALCPSQVQAAQVTRCLASAVTPSWRLHLITSPVPGFLGVQWAHLRFSGCTMGTPSHVCHVSLLRN